MYSNFSLLNRLRMLICVSFALCLLTACGNSDDADKVKQALELNELNITSITVISDNTIIEFDAPEQFTALAVIGDDTEGTLDISSKVIWHVSDTSLASINKSGLLTGKADGLVTITAQLADLSATKDLQLSSATLDSITVTNTTSPVSVCASGFKLKAEGNYSDATTRNITHLVDWTSSNETLAKVDSLGAYSTYRDGSVSFSATRADETGTVTIDVIDNLNTVTISAPANAVYINKTLAFSATGAYSDTSTKTITSNLNWSSSDSTILSVSNTSPTKGLAKGVATGSAAITATCNSTSPTISNSVSISVSVEPVINGIEIEDDQSIVRYKLADSPEQLTALLTLSNNTTGEDVSDDKYTTWSIGEVFTGKALSINAKGEISFSEVGETEVKVRYYDTEKKIGPFTDTITVEIVTN